MSEPRHMLSFSRDPEDTPPPPLPVGEYVATVSGAEIREGKSSGNPYLSLMLTVSPDQYPADYAKFGDPMGTTLSYNRTSLVDSHMARYRYHKLCGAFGVVASKDVDANQFMGRTATIVVEHEEYEGEQRAAVRSIKTF